MLTMAYAKWRLGRGDDYQRGVARLRVARLLDAHARGIDGPLALSCETPDHEEWDDIVEFGAAGGVLTTTHRQVKRQHGDFKDGTFAKLFERAAKILADAQPYTGLTIPPESRYFHFVLPTDQMSCDGLGIDQLRMLLDECAGNAADTIVADRGAKLDGKEGGDQKRKWLEAFRKATTDDRAAARLLRQLRVELRAAAEVAADNPELTTLFEHPDRARLLIDDAIHNLAPQGRLDAEELLPVLLDAAPRPSVRVVRLARHGNRFWAHAPVRNPDVGAVATAILEHAWRAHGAADVHVAFPCPDATASSEESALRLACVRLLLHARPSPTYVAGKVEWCDRGRIDTQRTLGGDDRGPIESEHYADRPAPAALPPVRSWPPNELAAALQDAMDARVWSAVRTQARLDLVGAKGVPFDDLADELAGVPDFFDKTLRGWWGLEQKASGVVRAGPGAAPNVARVVAGLAALRAAGYAVAAHHHETHIASIGTLTIRTLAIERASVEVGGEPIGVALAEHARQLLDHAGVVLIARGDPDSFYAFADPASIDESGADASMRAASPALLVTAESLIVAAKQKPKEGSSPVRDRVKALCNARARHHAAALDAALQQFQESDAA